MLRFICEQRVSARQTDCPLRSIAPVIGKSAVSSAVANLMRADCTRADEHLGLWQVQRVFAFDVTRRDVVASGITYNLSTAVHY